MFSFCREEIAIGLQEYKDSLIICQRNLSAFTKKVETLRKEIAVHLEDSIVTDNQFYAELYESAELERFKHLLKDYPAVKSLSKPIESLFNEFLLAEDSRRQAVNAKARCDLGIKINLGKLGEEPVKHHDVTTHHQV